MSGKRSALVVLALGLLVASGGCGERNNPVSPVDPQMTKGGKPSKPGASTEPELQEFWVYTKDDDEQCAHIVMSGTYIAMGFNPAYDYFFNGWQDLDDHYEVYQPGFPGGDIEYRDVDGVTLGHTDICYHGERRYTDEGPVYFKDFPTTDVDGPGGDPIAFIPVAVIENADRTQSFRQFRPRGVVVGGQTLGREAVGVTSVWDHDGDGVDDSFDDVRSFAISHGEEATEKLFVSDLSISNVTCAATTTTVGSGRNKQRISVAQVDLAAVADFGASPAPSAGGVDYWAEVHVLVLPEVGDQEGSGPIFVSARKTFNGTTADALATAPSTTFEADLADRTVYVELAVDYLFGMNGDYVYDPAENGVFTTVGFGYGTNGNAWSPPAGVSTTLDDGKFPVAHSNAVQVVCH